VAESESFSLINVAAAQYFCYARGQVSPMVLC
jgi:hypothetical protein